MPNYLHMYKQDLNSFKCFTAVTIEVFLKYCINSFAHKNKLI